MKLSHVRLLALSALAVAFAAPAFAGAHVHRAFVRGHGPFAASLARPAGEANAAPRRRFDEPQGLPRRLARPLPHLLEPGGYVLTALPPDGARPSRYEAPLAWRYAEPELPAPRSYAAQYGYDAPVPLAYAPVYAPPQIIRVGGDARRERHRDRRIAVIGGGDCPPQAVSRGSAAVIARY